MTSAWRPRAIFSDGHPIGLVDGTFLTFQHLPARQKQARLGRPDRLPEAVRAPLIFPELLTHDTELFEAAKKRDSSAFAGNDGAQAVVDAAWARAIETLRTNPSKLPIFVESERIGAEHVMFVHSHGRIYEAGRLPVAAFSDCDLWRIRLIFTVVSGVLIALFGLQPTLSSRASAYVAELIKTPKIAAALSSGDAMSAMGIFVIIQTLYQFGSLRPLVSLIVSLGVWATLRVIAKLVLTFAGVGAASTIASLAATGVSFVIRYRNRPKDCEPVRIIQILEMRMHFDPTTRYQTACLM
jgi:hypothetical protein